MEEGVGILSGDFSGRIGNPTEGSSEGVDTPDLCRPSSFASVTPSTPPNEKRTLYVHNRSRNIGDGIGARNASNHTISCKVFVGGICWQATEVDLSEYFSSYGAVVDAKVIRDTVTGKSKGYGFVTFSEEDTANVVKAVAFVDFLGRKCQVGDAVRGIARAPARSMPAAPASPGHHPFKGSAALTASSPRHSAVSSFAPAERRMFVGGLPHQTDERALHYFFSQWGPVAEVKIIYDNKRVSKGFGFVTFHDARSAAAVKSYGTVELMGRQMNVGDAVRGVAGRVRRSPPSHTNAPLAPAPLPMPSYALSSISYPGHSPVFGSPVRVTHNASGPYGLLGYPQGAYPAFQAGMEFASQGYSYFPAQAFASMEYRGVAAPFESYHPTVVPHHSPIHHPSGAHMMPTSESKGALHFYANLKGGVSQVSQAMQVPPLTATPVAMLTTPLPSTPVLVTSDNPPSAVAPVENQ
eukprot:CAMPEP_0114243784 /NCGR_PEP_ID=MMETSP0058-20121206/10980_1 /TAXON_ID=36894 /ORGANISM="Pyramimonas parkeae, CCMP726" /LENGTH=465 /DNA_ID=CAMNT_0001356659 /DNA_START=346 /DNA_END=1743 /DNA_ORIENTATION=+